MITTKGTKFCTEFTNFFVFFVKIFVSFVVRAFLKNFIHYQAVFYLILF